MSSLFRVLPLGGLGEIAENMSVVKCDGRIAPIDCGVRFPTAAMHGIDLVLPDFGYLLERRDSAAPGRQGPSTAAFACEIGRLR